MAFPYLRVRLGTKMWRIHVLLLERRRKELMLRMLEPLRRKRSLPSRRRKLSSGWPMELKASRIVGSMISRLGRSLQLMSFNSSPNSKVRIHNCWTYLLASRRIRLQSSLKACLSLLLRSEPLLKALRLKPLRQKPLIKNECRS
ncbi:hypothetical protein LIER_42168 [Lithospermum erythrorhizon]|uniref:Uncharacterized protein n=1 Tax=Lithospermum erythrorhizon TaxID=34254 RepID=A0AAV3RKE4_LITER